MLITCPECGLQISDKAITCPHCGYPLEPEVIKRVYTKPTKRAHRKLPNGFGSITEIKGRYLRNPFLARVCVGKTETGRPILRNLKPKAYFKTYNDAYAALVEYNRTPEECARTMTMQELYGKWSESYFEQVSESSRRTFISCWKKSSDVYKTYVVDLKAYQIRNIIDEEPSPNMKSRIKWMFDSMLDYAVEHDYVDKNISKSFKLGKAILNTGDVKQPHIVIAHDEIKRLWELIHEPYIDIILIGCYTGLRPNELLKLRNDDIDWDEQVIHAAGSKTVAGKNRIIPIHEKIKPLLKKRRNISEWLFNRNGYQITYSTYKYQFQQILPNHRPHDTRKTFVTYATESGVDEVAIKRIIGHAVDVTEGTYTDRSIDWLRKEMCKLSM